MPMDFRCLIKPLSIAALVFGVGTQAAAEIRLSPYALVGGGLVRLSPDPGGSGLELTESNTVGFNALLGLDLSSRWALEAGYNDLGAATLNSATFGEQEIAYKAYSFSTLFHLFGDSRDIAEREGAWTYLRLGINQIENESDLELEKANNTAIWAGVGFEWAFSSMLSVRGELASFDGDVQALTGALVFRPFDYSPRSRNSIVRPQPSTPKPVAVPEPAPAPLPAPAPQVAEEPRRLPIPTAPSVEDSIPEVQLVGCETPVFNEPVSSNGCAQLSGVRRGLQFIGESDQLTPESALSIASIADAMRSAPGILIEIRAHAESIRGAGAAQTISKQRAIAVAKALVRAGITVSRLGARAYGNKEPVVSTGSAVGEMLPNRIEIVVKP